MMSRSVFHPFSLSLWFIAGALLFAAVFLPGSAEAYQSPLGNAIMPHIGYVRGQLPAVAYGIAGVTILGVAALAMFGRFQWGWLFAIIGSVALVTAESYFDSGTGGEAQIGDVTHYVKSAGANNNLTSDSNALVMATAQNSRWIGYGIAALGAMGLAVMASFGRFRWGWLFSLCGGLLILGGYISLSNYISGSPVFSDTLGADQAAMALADGTGDDALFSQSETLARNTANNTRQIAYGLAGLGALALGTLAMLGRLQWRWFFALIGGLAVLAGLNEGLQYITG